MEENIKKLTRDLIYTRKYLTTLAPDPLLDERTPKLTPSRIKIIYNRFTHFCRTIGYDSLQEMFLLDTAEYNRTLRKITRTSTKQLGEVLRDRSRLKRGLE